MKNRLIISFLAIFALVLGIFIYFLSTRSLVSEKNYKVDIQKIENVSDSDELTDIEDDLNDTDLDSIDTELINIENELN